MLRRVIMRRVIIRRVIIRRVAMVAKLVEQVRMDGLAVHAE